MAKSQRSKVKRSFRREKREGLSSAYQVIESARLQRLSAKLRAKFADDAATGDDAEVVMKDAGDGSPAGWLEFALFGLIDQDDLGFASRAF